MKTASVRALRNRFAHHVSDETNNKSNLVKPDIVARLKKTWGDRVFSTKEAAEMRAAELAGEEGKGLQ